MAAMHSVHGGHNSSSRLTKSLHSLRSFTLAVAFAVVARLRRGGGRLLRGAGRPLLAFHPLRGLLLLLAHLPRRCLHLRTRRAWLLHTLRRAHRLLLPLLHHGLTLGASLRLELLPLRFDLLLSRGALLLHGTLLLLLHCTLLLQGRLRLLPLGLSLRLYPLADALALRTLRGRLSHAFTRGLRRAARSCRKNDLLTRGLLLRLSLLSL
jgi:hypothetical protein